jgi:hypothetical protein
VVGLPMDLLLKLFKDFNWHSFKYTIEISAIHNAHFV